MVALLLLSYRCNVTVNVQWLFLTVPWVGLQCVIVVFPDHTHLLIDKGARPKDPKIADSKNVGDVIKCLGETERT